MEEKDSAVRKAPCAISYTEIYRDERQEMPGKKARAGLKEACTRIFRLGAEAAVDSCARTMLLRRSDARPGAWNGDGLWNEPGGLPESVKKNPALPVLQALDATVGAVEEDATGMLRYRLDFDRRTVRKVTQRALRGDTVLAYDIVLRPDPRTFYEKTAGWTPKQWNAGRPEDRGRFLWDRWQKFVQFAVEAAKSRWGGCAVAVALHYEGAPHVHVVAVPAEEGILNSARALGLCEGMADSEQERDFCEMFKAEGFRLVVASEPFPGAAGCRAEVASGNEAEAGTEPAPFPGVESQSLLESCVPVPESPAQAGCPRRTDCGTAPESVVLETVLEPDPEPEAACEVQEEPAVQEPASGVHACGLEPQEPEQICVQERKDDGSPCADPDELDMKAALDGSLLALLEQEMPVPGLEPGTAGVLDVPEGACGTAFGLALAACTASGTRLWSLPAGARPVPAAAAFVLCGPGARAECIVAAGRTGSAMDSGARDAAAQRLACIPKDAVPGWDELPRMLASWARGRALLVAGGLGGVPGIGRMLADCAASSGCAALMLRRPGDPEPEDCAWRGTLASCGDGAWRIAAAGAGLFRFDGRVSCKAEGTWMPGAS